MKGGVNAAEGVKGREVTAGKVIGGAEFVIEGGWALIGETLRGSDLMGESSEERMTISSEGDWGTVLVTAV